MEYDTITAFQATQSACLRLIKKGYDFNDSCSRNKSCTWEKELNENKDSLQISISDAFVSVSQPAPADPIVFDVNIHICGIMNVQVINHKLKLNTFDSDLDALEAMVNGMINKFRSNNEINNYECRIAS